MSGDDADSAESTVGVYRPPCEAVENLSDTANYDGLVRRVCPNCRCFFDVGQDSDQVFCGGACEGRHQRGEFL